MDWSRSSFKAMLDGIWDAPTRQRLSKVLTGASLLGRLQTAFSYGNHFARQAFY